MKACAHAQEEIIKVLNKLRVKLRNLINKVFKVSDVVFDALYQGFIAGFFRNAHANILVPHENQAVLQ